MKKIGPKNEGSKEKYKEKSIEKQIQSIYGSPTKVRTPGCKAERKIFQQNRDSRVQIDRKCKRKKEKPKQKTLKKYDSKSSSKSGSNTLSKGKNIGNNKTRKSLHQVILKSPPAPNKTKQRNLPLEKIVEQLKNGQTLVAQNSLLKLSKENPQNFQVSYYLGRIQQGKNNWEGAKKYYKQCIKIGAHTDEEFQLLVNCYFYMTHYEKVIEICERLLQKTKIDSLCLIQIKGKAQFQLGKYGPALDSFTRAIQKNLTNYKNYEYQGDCYRMMSAYQVALNSYKTAASHYQAQSVSLLQKQAECHQKLGDKQKCEAIIKKILYKQQQLQQHLTPKIKINIPKIQRKQKIESDHLKSSYGSSETVYLPAINGQKDSNNSSISNSLQHQMNNGQYGKALQTIEGLLQLDGEQNIKLLEIKAKILYNLEEYEKCEQTMNKVVKASDSPISPLIHLLIPNQQESRGYSNLRCLMQKLKELNAYALTQSQDNKIVERRKKCLQQAIYVLKDTSQNSSVRTSYLNVIMQQSSIASSRLYDFEPTSILTLRNLRKVLKNWCTHNFSLQSLKQTTRIAKMMVGLQPKQFSILPFHILHYTTKPENIVKTFSEVNKQIEQVLDEIMIIYPPSQKNISKSTINTFDIQWKDNPKINLLNSHAVFKSFKQIHKALLILAQKAQKQYLKITQICQNYCLIKNKGFKYKSGLKLEKTSANQYQERVFCRIIEKMFKKQIAMKKQLLFQAIKFEKNKDFSYYSTLIHSQWEKLINSIIQEKSQKNQEIKCYVYDLVRAKCMFYNVRDIKQTVQSFIKAHEASEIYIIEIDNRLNFRTRDVVIKFRVDWIVAELQLAIQFQSLQNQFSHGLYELARSPFGGFFASLMWFSGFALKKHRLFFKQKIKWQLKGLQSLTKYIYCEQLIISFINPNSLVFQKFTLIDFEITIDTLVGHLFDKQKNKYLTVKNGNVEYCAQQPNQKFLLKIHAGNIIISEDQFFAMIRIQNTSNFLTIAQQELKLLILQDSAGADLIKIRVQSSISNQQQKELMIQASEMQKKVAVILQTNQ